MKRDDTMVNKLKASHQTNWELLNHDFRWTSQAACKESPISMFFPEKGDSIKIVEQAKAICNSCVVKTDCLNFAIDNFMPYGIWGGTSIKERRYLRSAKKHDPL